MRERIDPVYWRETKFSGAGPMGPNGIYIRKLQADAERMREALEAAVSAFDEERDGAAWPQGCLRAEAIIRAALNPENK